MKPIARFQSPFTSKFGIPKQSGLAQSIVGKIVFEPEFRSLQALQGLDGYDYIWLIWHFSGNKASSERLMVRPPVLGGNEKVGVFASRSPFRPNGLGLSSVRLQRIEWHTPDGPVLHVLGADLMNGTPIFDIKPYIAYADSHAEARSGFTSEEKIRRLPVDIHPIWQQMMRPEQLKALEEVLALDPRPAYHHDESKVYGMPFYEWDIKFSVVNGRVVVQKPAL